MRTIAGNGKPVNSSGSAAAWLAAAVPWPCISSFFPRDSNTLSSGVFPTRRTRHAGEVGKGSRTTAGHRPGDLGLRMGHRIHVRPDRDRRWIQPRRSRSDRTWAMASRRRAGSAPTAKVTRSAWRAATAIPLGPVAAASIGRRLTGGGEDSIPACALGHLSHGSGEAREGKRDHDVAVLVIVLDLLRTEATHVDSLLPVRLLRRRCRTPPRSAASRSLRTAPHGGPPAAAAERTLPMSASGKPVTVSSLATARRRSSCARTTAVSASESSGRSVRFPPSQRTCHAEDAVLAGYRRLRLLSWPRLVGLDGAETRPAAPRSRGPTPGNFFFSCQHDPHPLR